MPAVVEIYRRHYPTPQEVKKFSIREVAEKHLIGRGFKPNDLEGTQWHNIDKHCVDNYATITSVTSCSQS